MQRLFNKAARKLYNGGIGSIRNQAADDTAIEIRLRLRQESRNPEIVLGAGETRTLMFVNLVVRRVGSCVFTWMKSGRFMNGSFSRTDDWKNCVARTLGMAAALICLFPIAVHAQLVSNIAAIPDTGRAPVVFLNGYEFGCAIRPTFASSFGMADQLLAADGRPVLFFNNCDVPGNVAIEDLSAAFGTFLGNLRYSDGRPVPQVDVVAYSLGGMIVRSYLAGKARERGVFRPPADPRIRKAVFLATPFFGSYIADLQSPDVQSGQLQVGSTFIFDLATWNQYRDDLRGVDAIAVAANGGSGFLSGFPRFDDSTVSLTSASLEWWQPGRTRIVDYCHTVLTGILTAGCTNPGISIARMTDAMHDSARITRSFLAGTNEWQTVGVAPADNMFLRQRGGVAVQFRDEIDQTIMLTTATATNLGALRIRSGEIVFNENVLAQVPLQVSATSTGNAVFRSDIALTPGLTRAAVVTLGGINIGAVIPAFVNLAWPHRDHFIWPHFV